MLEKFEEKEEESIALDLILFFFYFISLLYSVDNSSLFLPNSPRRSLTRAE
jgi:hypothetical protein